MRIHMKVNGFLTAADAAPTEPLLQILRDRLGLVGAKEPCGKGECGGCTVVMNGHAVNACLVMAAQADGAEIVTVEGLAAGDGGLHPVQQAFVDAGAVQCGYCMTGMVMSAYALLQRSPHPTPDEVKEGMEGNLCRCTGYQKIFDAVNLAATRGGR